MQSFLTLFAPWGARRFRAVRIGMCLLCGWLALTAVADADRLGPLLEDLKTRPIAELGEVTTQLAALEDPRVRPIFKALLEGRLYTRKSDGLVVIGSPVDTGISAVDARTTESLGVLGKLELKKIAVNNALRTDLRGLLARLDLTTRDPAERLKAVESLGKSGDAAGLDLLRGLVAQETAPPVKEAMQVAIALADIAAEDPATRIAAVKTLGASSNPEAANKLGGLLEKDDAGEFVESHPDVRQAAKTALQDLSFRLALYQGVETAFFGLSLGAVLVLAAIGLAITFGVMGVINMAHGELMMLGAYTTYVVQELMPNHIAWSLFVAIPAAFVLSGLVGMAIERGIIRFMYGRPLETLLATFGVSLFLQQLVRTVFSPLNRSVITPDWMSGSVQINSVLSLTLNRCYILGFSLLVFLALLLLLKRTRLGLEVRAVTQNREMAKAMGIPTDRVDMLTFGLGSGIAGVAGVALSQLTNVGPNLGQSYIVDSFMVVVFGGVGNLWGTLLGGLSLGIANKILEPTAGAVLAKILVLAFIIVFIQKRPRGLFPQKGRAVEA